MSALELIQPETTSREVAPQASVAPAQSPAGMMLALMAKGASLAEVGQMMDLQERWEKREAEKAFNSAFASFKAEAVRVIKNKDVSAGPLAGKKYAELFSVVNAVTPALSKHGLSAAWKLTKDEKDWIEVTCTIKHVQGHSDSVSMGGPPDIGGARNPIQARASTVSYLERYTLKAITGLSEQEDDNDGGHGGGGGEADPLIDAGQAAAMEGMAALTAWWGKLTAKQRGNLNKEFAAMRKAATLADEGGARG